MTVILYAQLGTTGFKKFHTRLVEMSGAGKIAYVYRHYIQVKRISQNFFLLYMWQNFHNLTQSLKMYTDYIFTEIWVCKFYFSLVLFNFIITKRLFLLYNIFHLVFFCFWLYIPFRLFLYGTKRHNISNFGRLSKLYEDKLRVSSKEIKYTYISIIIQWEN